MRDAEEYAAGHLSGALHIPGDQLPGRLANERGGGERFKAIEAQIHAIVEQQRAIVGQLHALQKQLLATELR